MRSKLDSVRKASKAVDECKVLHSYALEPKQREALEAQLANAKQELQAVWDTRDSADPDSDVGFYYGDALTVGQLQEELNRFPDHYLVSVSFDTRAAEAALFAVEHHGSRYEVSLVAE